MTTKIVLIGGNGYIGRTLTAAWNAQDSESQFYVLSRSGRNELQLPNLTNVPINLADFDAISAAIPAQIDYVVDLAGRPEKNPEASIQVNDRPAELMQYLAEYHGAKVMGFIGGKLGPKYFTDKKRALIQQLSQSTVPLVTVEPTLVYGNGRQDSMTRMVPLLKIIGLLIPNFKPVDVNDVVTELLAKIVAIGKDRQPNEN